ncbi:MAG TPA: aminotransferase class III-fold pyridoxal phosphate-dependent enzyme, partial [Acidimicrobiia bacterium]
MSSFWHPFANMAAVAGHEIEIERGEGVYVYDTTGRRYLDGTASLWYANIGYGRREIAEAVANQIE